MMPNQSPDYLIGLVHELIKLSNETEWVEFKLNDARPKEIGEYVSALSNSAALCGKAYGYVVWGISDGDHRIVGTEFSAASSKIGNEELENWLLRLLAPKINFQFSQLNIDGHQVVLLEIERAFRHPVRFEGQEFIRVGSYKKKLKDHPEKERALWRVFDETPFESGIAAERVEGSDVLKLIDYPAYFDLMKVPLPADRDGILHALEADNLIQPCAAGGWDITNLGAILFAKKLADFRALGRKPCALSNTAVTIAWKR